jgi:hypothetical protein
MLEMKPTGSANVVVPLLMQAAFFDCQPRHWRLESAWNQQGDLRWILHQAMLVGCLTSAQK